MNWMSEVRRCFPTYTDLTKSSENTSPRNVNVCAKTIRSTRKPCSHRASRALDEFLIAQQPEVADWPNSRKKAELERLRTKFTNTKAYEKLVTAAEGAQAELEADYPQLFVTDEAINAAKKAAREAASNDPAFKKTNDERTAAYRTQQDYLLTVDKKLADLEQLSKQSRD
jgi:hypothetical protein